MSFYDEGAPIEQCFKPLNMNFEMKTSKMSLLYHPGMSYSELVEKEKQINTINDTNIVEKTLPKHISYDELVNKALYPKIKIGFWRLERFIEDDLPFPEENSCKLSVEDKTKFIENLKEVESISDVVHMRGFSSCRICHKHNGHSEFTYIKNKKQYVFPSGYIHYIKDHNVSIDPEFYAVIMSYYKN